jgi:hypothetical protein
MLAFKQLRSNLPRGALGLPHGDLRIAQCSELSPSLKKNDFTAHVLGLFRPRDRLTPSLHIAPPLARVAKR